MEKAKLRFLIWQKTFMRITTCLLNILSKLPWPRKSCQTLMFKETTAKDINNCLIYSVSTFLFCAIQFLS
eukprot:m.3400 g.3400  ORF g.3400 m.3400 type:complete len:70 (+) comp9346_c0_seq1:3426-3635(+)